MPQSEEHLAVLDLLGIERGVVALTKTDRVDEDLVELATLEIEERLVGTSLEGVQIVGVSAVERTGLGELSSALQTALDPPTPLTGRPRLWVDRAFTISGAGTVVTGTLTGASLTVGDQIEVHPGPRSGRIRSLQSHEADRRVAEPGSRVAVNIVGLERQQVRRGSMLGLPGHWAPSDRMLVSLRRARYVEDELTNRGAYHLHLGSGAWPVQLRSIGHLDDGSALATLTLEEAVPVKMGDRFVLREVGRRSIVAGGRVLEPIAPRKARASRDAADALERALASSPDVRATALLERRGVEATAVLTAHSGGGTAPDAIVAGAVELAPRRAQDLANRAVELTVAFHAANPLRPGLPKASLASQLAISPEAVGAVLAHTADLEERGSAVAAADFAATLDTDSTSEWERIRHLLAEAGLAVPRVKELDIDRELMHVLLRETKLVRISGDLVYLPEQLDELIGRLAELPDRFTVSEFRDGLGLTRKYAVPLVEWLDGQKITIRDGDERTLA